MCLELYNFIFYLYFVPFLPQIMVYDVNTRHIQQIPNLVNPLRPDAPAPVAPHYEPGIHAIEINPSKTLLATGGKSANEIAVYRLPTLDPVCLGEVILSFN